MPSLIDDIEELKKSTLVDDIRDSDLGPPLQEEGADSLMGVPTPTVPLTTAPAPSSPPLTEPEPSWWDNIKMGLALSGEIVAVRQEAEAEAHKSVFEFASLRDRPWNALRVFLYEMAKAEHTIGTADPTFLAALKKKKPTLMELSPGLRALKRGFFAEEYRSYPEIEMMAVLGPELDAKAHAWIDRHWYLKAAHTVNEYAQEFVLENLVEAALVSYAAKPALAALAVKTKIGGKVGFKIAPKWTAEQCVNAYVKQNAASIAASKRGFIHWMTMQHKIKNPKVSFDDLIRHNIDNPIESVIRPLKAWPEKPTLEQSKRLFELYGSKLSIKTDSYVPGHYTVPGYAIRPFIKGKVTLDESLFRPGGLAKKFPAYAQWTPGRIILHELGHDIWYTKLGRAARKSFGELVPIGTANRQSVIDELFANTFFQLNIGAIDDIDVSVLDKFNRVMKQAGLEDEFVENMNQVMGELIWKPKPKGIAAEIADAQTEEVGKALLRRKGAKLKGKPTARVTKEASRLEQIVDLKRESIVTSDKIEELSNRIIAEIDPRIAEAKTMLSFLETDISATPAQINAASRRLDMYYRTKEHLLNVLDKKWAKVKQIETTMAGLQSGQYIDWADISRGIRVKYLADSVAADLRPKDFGKQIKNIADAVSLGRLQEIIGPDEFEKLGYNDILTYLSDDEFAAAFDYIEIIKTAPANYKYATKVPPVLFGKTLTKPRRYVWMPFYSWFTPARLWYERSGIPIIPKVGRQALTDQTRHIIRVIDGWDEVLKPLGGAKMVKDLPTMKRIFHAANGEFLEFRKLANDAGLSPKQIADEFNAAKYINTVGDEIFEMWDAQGRWPAGLDRKKFYIRNIVDWTFEDTAKDKARLGQILNIIQKRTLTKIDINEFKNRVASHNFPLIENADTALRMGLFNSTYKLYAEPSYKQMTALAAATGNEDVITYTRRLINYGLRGESTPLERFADKTVFNNIAHALEKGSSILPERFQFVAQERAAKQFLNTYRRIVYDSTLIRPRPAVTNLFQQMLDIPLTNAKTHFWGQQVLFTGGGKELARHCDLVVGRMPLTDFDPGMFSKLERAGFKGFRSVDKYPNVLGSFNSNCIYLAMKDEAALKILNQYGDFTNPFRNPNSASRVLADAFDAGELKDLKWAANSRATLSQYDYTAFGQPMAMIAGGPVTKAAFQFGTWSSNYYYGYLPELLKASLTGTGPDGVALGVLERQMYLRHYLQMQTLVLAASTQGIDLAKHVPPGPSAEFPFVQAGGAMPSGPSPVYNLGVGLTKQIWGILRRDERMAAEGKAQRKRGLPFAPPVLAKELWEVAQEGKPISTLLFKLKEEEEWETGGFGRPSIYRPRR